MDQSTARLWTVLGAVLLPVLALAGVLWHWSAGGTEWRLSNVTGISGELPPGGSLGQSFTPRYPGLSAVGLQIATYQRVNTGTLDLRLLGADNRELARATLAKPALVDNGVAWFGFAPLPAATAGQVLRLELRDPTAVPGRNTVTVYINDRDPYGGGTAYLNGTAVPGVDLAFGTRYTVMPPELWAGQIAAWARAVPPLLVMLGALSGLGWLAGSVWLIVQLSRALLLVSHPDSAGGQAGLKPAPTPQDGQQAEVKPAPTPQDGQQAGLKPAPTPQNRGGRLLRVPVPDARALVLVALLGLAHAVAWAVFMPPWQGPDEPAHLAAAVVLAKDGRPVEDPVVRAAIIASMDRRQFTRYVPWAPEPGAGANRFLNPPGLGIDTIWNQERQPRLYYSLLAAVFHLPGLAPGSATWPDTNQVERLLYAGRLVSALLQTLVVALAVLVGRTLFGHAAGGAAVGLAVALLPMPVFVHAMVNNDVLAAVAGAVLALYAVRTIRRPRLADLILLVIGVGLAVTAKTTALPAVTLALGGLALGLWLRAGRRVRLVAAGAVAAGVLLLAGLAVAAIDTTGRARFWVSPQTLLPGPGLRQAAAQPRDGRYTLAVAPGEQVMQRVDLPPGHGVYTATATVWARGTGQGSLSLAYDYAVPAQLQGIALGPVWAPISLTVQVPASAAAVRVALQAGAGGQAEFDDAGLRLIAPPGAPDPQAGQNELANGSFETPARVPPAGLRQRLGFESASLLNYALDPTGLDQFWGQEVRQFRSFWGSFGWVAVDLDDGVYTALAGLILVALLGVVVALLPGRDAAASDRAPRIATILLMAAILAGAILLSFARTASGAEFTGTREFPQGRYLFPLLIPCVCLLLFGLADGARRALAAGALGRARAAAVLAWLRYGGAVALVAFALLAFTSMLTFYYGLP